MAMHYQIHYTVPGIILRHKENRTTYIVFFKANTPIHTMHSVTKGGAQQKPNTYQNVFAHQEPNRKSTSITAPHIWASVAVTRKVKDDKYNY